MAELELTSLNKVMCSTGPQLTKQSKLAEVIERMLGRELTEKEISKGFDLEELVGTECNILVLQSKSKIRCGLCQCRASL